MKDRFLEDFNYNEDKNNSVMSFSNTLDSNKFFTIDFTMVKQNNYDRIYYYDLNKSKDKPVIVRDIYHHHYPKSINTRFLMKILLSNTSNILFFIEGYLFHRKIQYYCDSVKKNRAVIEITQDRFIKDRVYHFHRFAIIIGTSHNSYNKFNTFIRIATDDDFEKDGHYNFATLEQMLDTVIKDN